LFLQVVVLRVSIHCEGCKKKVKKVLQNINGKFLFDLRIVYHASSRAFSAAFQKNFLMY
jgi:copper chaperone CopZ